MSRINTNVPSLLAARILGNNNEALNRSLERLSTGLRINRGKDDPAGLIASETLRGEITAISSAINNARRADNIVAVAEGSLQEVSNLLIELEGLVDSTANEAGLSAEEVAANQLQIDSILDTINRIATSTEFQGKKLLNGSLDYTTSAVTSTNVSSVDINSARLPEGGYRTVVVDVTSSAQTAQVTRTGAATAAGVTTLQIAGKNGIEQLSFASGTTIANVATAVNQSTALTGVSAATSGTTILFNSTDYGTDAFVTVTALSGTFTGGTDYGVNVGATINGTQANSNGLVLSMQSTALSLDLTLTSTFGTQTATDETFYVTGGGADFSIAPTVGLAGTASIGISNVSTGSLGNASIGYLSSLGSGQTNQMSAKNFETAQRIIRQANKEVTTLRGRLGSFQKSTLGSTISALQVALENTTAAESAIRDADFAHETSQLTRAQILVNSSYQVLQLANAAPQNVLALLG